MESTINVIKETERTWNTESAINVIKEHGKYYQCNQRTRKVLSM